jgi:hypothetical protein
MTKYEDALNWLENFASTYDFEKQPEISIGTEMLMVFRDMIALDKERKHVLDKMLTVITGTMQHSSDFDVVMSSLGHHDLLYSFIKGYGHLIENCEKCNKEKLDRLKDAMRE